MDPAVMDLLMSDGALPHFSRLRQEGAYGRLISQKPLLSPVIWTTIATGKTPDQHGIGHFVAVNSDTGERLPVTSRLRKAKASYISGGQLNVYSTLAPFPWHTHGTLGHKKRPHPATSPS